MVGQLEPSLKRKAITLQQIADQCGVAKSTVQRALAGKMDEVSEATIRRIMATAEEMGYNPQHHHAARRMLGRRYGTPVCNQALALFFPKDFYGMNYFLMMFRGVLDELTAHSFDLVTSYVSEIPKYVPNSIQRGDVDGAIVFAHPNPFARLLKSLRDELNFDDRPVVSLLFPALPGCSAVLTDDFGGAYAAVSHLLELGHRAIVHFYPQDLEAGYHVQQRTTAYRQACHDHGVDPAEVLFPVKMDYSLQGEDRTVMPLLEMARAHPEITAILARNDVGAIAAWQALTAQGYQVPRDYSIIGFDDADAYLDGKTRENLLTSVHLPLQEVGREAARMVIGRLRGEQGEKFLTLPTTLMTRRSTAPPRKRRQK